MFEQLTQRLQKTLSGLRGVSRVDEKTLDEGLKDLRMALLEADVNYGVVKDFLGRVREKALGEEVTGSLTPGQQVVKVVHDELIELLGGARESLRLEGAAPHVLMLVGLQGAGKTTTAAKLGHWLRSRGHSPLLASVDVHRPAAREQLRQMAGSADLAAFEESRGTEPDDPLELARQALDEARGQGHDALILDTAGRLHLDDRMMQEAVDLAGALEPDATLYVADSLAGQDAVNSVSAFADALRLDGLVLSKLDGDARGGVALSIVAVTGLPILFVGVGERHEDLELFHPDRMASRVLGMGDMLSLIEKAEQTVDAEQAVAMQEKLRKATFDLEDFRQQIEQMRKMGPISKILEMLPNLGGGVDLESIAPAEEDVTRFTAIIDSMTPEERRDPSIINGSRRRRIALGSGTSVQEVNQLIKQFKVARKLMKKVGKQGASPMDLMKVQGLGR